MSLLGDFMKIKQIILLSALSISILPVMAYTTPDELSSTEQLVNYNFSRTTADHIQLLKAQNANIEYKTERLLKRPWYKKLWYYLDPAYDDGTLLQHSIEPAHSWRDY